MDFVVKKGDLLRELQYVQGVVERKTTVPILSNILLETTGNSLRVVGTDLDVTIRCGCAAQVKVSGAITISARKLFDIARLLPDADVHFKTEGAERVHVTCLRSRFKIAGLGKENFPDVPIVDGEKVRLNGADLRYMISRSIFAITQEESRFALSGGLLILRPKQMSLVTTDGHRLALISKQVDMPGVEGEMRNLVPRKTLVELSKLTGSGDAEVEFARTENHFFFNVGDRVLISRILSGQFPNYEMVLPKGNDKELILNTLDFADALRRVAVMADDQSKAIRFDLKEDQLEISANSADYGEARETLAAQYHDEPLSVCFNAQYLLEFLAGLECEEVTISLKDSETQGLAQPRAQEDYAYSYVVMPMKL